MNIVWSSVARQDITDLLDYISAYNPKAALKLVEGMESYVESLKKSPRIGRKVSEKDKPEIRELLYKKYRIIYQILSKNDIRILTVIHRARNFDLTQIL
jgi:plasmid stabilization system protein ParE